MGARLALGLALLLITYMALTPLPDLLQQSVNDKLGHGLVFALLSFLSHAAWPRRAFGWRHGLPLLAYGIALECLQYFVPGRYFSYLDMLADASGIAAYLLASRLLLSLRLGNTQDSKHY
ncbi:VanZ family protein [Thiolapillus sp.]